MTNKIALLGVAALSLAAGAATAGDDVTIYGVADIALVQASQAKGENLYLRTGNLASSRIGFRGDEQLGDGLKSVFVLEAGYDLSNGASSQPGSLFNRQAYAGLSDVALGTATLGRQYTAYYQFVGPIGPVNFLTGATGAHAGDIDDLDVTVRSSNSFVYISPAWNGFQGGLSLATAGQADHTGGGGAASAGLKYDVGDWNFALGYQLLKNGQAQLGWDANASTSFSKSALNAGYLSAAALHYAAAAVRYHYARFSAGVLASSVAYRPNSSSLFRDTAMFNTAGAHLAYQATAQWFVAAGLAYTRENASNGISDPAHYLQLSLEETYSLSKRTALYLTQAQQRARGRTLGADGIHAVDAVAVVGDSQTGSPGSGGSQHVFMAGIRHNF